MPLNKKQSKVKKVFEKEYGKSKGDKVFFGYEAKHFGIKRGKR